MKIYPTQRLFFKKFCYCIKYNIPCENSNEIRTNTLLRELKSAIKSFGIPYRSRVDWWYSNVAKKVQYSLYLSDKTAYEKLIDMAKSHVTETHVPLNDDHRSKLENKVEVLFRKQLLYKKFKYKVYFKPWRMRDRHNNEIEQYISEYFQDQVNSRAGDYIFTGYWRKCLYLTNECDLVAIKLALSENIYSIIQIEVIESNQS